ncbi:MAG TPA: 5-oxoprolinase subunit PxpA [Bryobacteraceae bacterium]|nr:5-oxoprolinase subunit PxpA [Bryobacteraceae bacterium]
MIDLNCDAGELEDADLEAELLAVVTSVSIACGAHAGDEAVMERTARLALARRVRIGAHPSYPDRENFGRVKMDLTPAEIEKTVSEQIARLAAVVERQGGELAHVKPHGALYNVAAHDAGTARAVGRAVAAWNPRGIILGLAGSPALGLWREMGLSVAAEAFADRRYEPDGSLRSRKFADALITDPQEAAAQARRFAKEGKAQTICIHSDTPGAREIARACRKALEAC